MHEICGLNDEVTHAARPGCELLEVPALEGVAEEGAAEADGKGSVESFTVIYSRNGDVEHGVVMLRTPDNARALARVPAHDGATLAHLLNMDRTPVGSTGDIVSADDGVLEWRCL